MTANDSDVSDGDTLTGSQVVRVYGENLTAPFVTLTFGDVEYTPLTQGEGYIEFILGDNGTATISVDGEEFMTFSVEGIVVPEGLPSTMAMWRKYYYDGGVDGLADKKEVTANCINYPYIVTEELRAFRFRPRLGNSDADRDKFSFVNCECIFNAWNTATQISLNLRPIDANKPCIVKWEDFIIAVFNYTTD